MTLLNFIQTNKENSYNFLCEDCFRLLKNYISTNLIDKKINSCVNCKGELK